MWRGRGYGLSVIQTEPSTALYKPDRAQYNFFPVIPTKRAKRATKDLKVRDPSLALRMTPLSVIPTEPRQRRASGGISYSQEIPRLNDKRSLGMTQKDRRSLG